MRQAKSRRLWFIGQTLLTIALVPAFLASQVPASKHLPRYRLIDLGTFGGPFRTDQPMVPEAASSTTRVSSPLTPTPLSPILTLRNSASTLTALWLMHIAGGAGLWKTLEPWRRDIAVLWLTSMTAAGEWGWHKPGELIQSSGDRKWKP